MSHGIEFYDQIGTLTAGATRIPRVVQVLSSLSNTTYNLSVPDFDTREGYLLHLGNNTSSSTNFTFNTFDYSFSGTTLTINTNDCSGSFIIGFGS